MKLIKAVLFSLLLILFSSQTFAMEKIFYVLRFNQALDYGKEHHLINTLSKHKKDVDVIITQAFIADGNGVLWGSINPKLLEFAHKNHMGVVPFRRRSIIHSCCLKGIATLL